MTLESDESYCRQVWDALWAARRDLDTRSAWRAKRINNAILIIEAVGRRSPHWLIPFRDWRDQYRHDDRRLLDRYFDALEYGRDTFVWPADMDWSSLAEALRYDMGLEVRDEDIEQCLRDEAVSLAREAAGIYDPPREEEDEPESDCSYCISTRDHLERMQQTVPWEQWGPQDIQQMIVLCLQSAALWGGSLFGDVNRHEGETNTDYAKRLFYSFHIRNIQPLEGTTRAGWSELAESLRNPPSFEAITFDTAAPALAERTTAEIEIDDLARFRRGADRNPPPQGPIQVALMTPSAPCPDPLHDLDMSNWWDHEIRTRLGQGQVQTQPGVPGGWLWMAQPEPGPQPQRRNPFPMSEPVRAPAPLNPQDARLREHGLNRFAGLELPPESTPRPPPPTPAMVPTRPEPPRPEPRPEPARPQIEPPKAPKSLSRFKSIRDEW